MTKQRNELFGVLSRILVYVIVMSLCERAYVDSRSQAWRMIPAAIILGLLLAGVARKMTFHHLAFQSIRRCRGAKYCFCFHYLLWPRQIYGTELCYATHHSIQCGTSLPCYVSGLLRKSCFAAIC